ncbi:hypothetical protein BJ944DRAFT_272332 [Cunninghamella echinulata]|nr:hypothetical protein BJ944DRAFT_272332 [Cunninghamella echinulata]
MSIIYNAKIITANTHYMIFHKCRECNGKIIITQQNRKRPYSYLNQYYCPDCQLHIKSNTTPMYNLQLKIYNPATRTNDNYIMYNEATETILGCPAQQYVSFIQQENVNNNSSFFIPNDRFFGDKISERLKEYTWHIILRKLATKKSFSNNSTIDALIPVLPSTEHFHPILPSLFPSILDFPDTSKNSNHNSTDTNNNLDLNILKLDQSLSTFL